MNRGLRNAVLLKSRKRVEASQPAMLTSKLPGQVMNLFQLLSKVDFKKLLVINQNSMNTPPPAQIPGFQNIGI
jgi:hypothetical protein